MINLQGLLLEGRKPNTTPYYKYLVLDLQNVIGARCESKDPRQRNQDFVDAMPAAVLARGWWIFLPAAAFAEGGSFKGTMEQSDSTLRTSTPVLVLQERGNPAFQHKARSLVCAAEEEPPSRLVRSPSMRGPISEVLANLLPYRYDVHLPTYDIELDMDRN